MTGRLARLILTWWWATASKQAKDEDFGGAIRGLSVVCPLSRSPSACLFRSTAMPDSLSPAVLSPPAILADLDWQQPGRRELAERIVRTLSVLSTEVRTTQDGPPPDRPIDLVISERPAALADLGLLRPGFRGAASG